MKSEEVQLTKQQCALNILDNIINSQQFLAFSDFNYISYGFLDFQWSTRGSNISLKKLKQQVKLRKKFSNQWFISQLKKIFIQISDYVLLSDPLQATCKLGLQMISNYQKSQGNFTKRFKQHQENSRQILSKRKAIDFKRQIQMAFYLQSYENDEDLMRKIGEVCQIISETQNQYIFDLSASDLWLALIQKNNE